MPLVDTASMIAMPSSASRSTSVMRSWPCCSALAMMPVTELPLELNSSSGSGGRSISPLLSSTGASLTALINTVLTAGALTSVPSLMVISTKRSLMSGACELLP